MPAKHLLRVNHEGTYCHIYNKGIEGKSIFADNDDYAVFINYLKSYLTPADLETTKTHFTVKGRTFRGTPHQPNNYYGQVEILAFKLMPDHFHLLLHQKTIGSVEKFMRSISTRYSIYFNKKYHRDGPLFAGPYKSAFINDAPQLLFLTHHIYNCHKGKIGKDVSIHSSYPEYIGKRQSTWVTTNIVLSSFQSEQASTLKGVENYQQFIEEYEATDTDKKSLEKVILETLASSSSPLERRILPSELPLPMVVPKIAPGLKADLEQDAPIHHLPFLQISVISLLFIILVALGVRNIEVSSATTPTTSTVPSSLQSTQPEEIIPEQKISSYVLVKITDGARSVNIRQRPTTNSPQVSKAKDGDKFELVSTSPDWYEIKLADKSIGYISAKYSFIEESTN
jgi:putative transposase